jgi:hypothetical protein
MDQPAQTVNYMIAGYVVIFGTLIGYLISLITRWRKLNEEKKMLTEDKA